MIKLNFRILFTLLIAGIGLLRPSTSFAATNHPYVCDGSGDDTGLTALFDDASVVDNDTITVSGTCTFTVGATFGTSTATTKTVTIDGSAAAVNWNYSLGIVFSIYATPGKFVRVTGFTVTRLGGTSGAQAGGIFRINGISTTPENCRVDHNRILTIRRNAVMFGAACLFDNNTVTSTTSGTDNPIYTRNGEDTGNNQKGFASGSRSLYLGDANGGLYGDGAYVENNTFFNCTPNAAEDGCDTSTIASYSAQNISDGEFGGRFTVRFNRFYNFTGFVVHGTEGANRGQIKNELYANNLYIYTNGNQGFRGFEFRSGNGVAALNNIIYVGSISSAPNFGNAFTTNRAQVSIQPIDQVPTSGNTAPWGPQCIGWSPYDNNVGTQQLITGNHTGTTANSPTLEDNTKDFTSYSPTLLRSGVYNNNENSASYKKQGWIYSYTATTIETLAQHTAPATYCSASDGQPCWNEGDAYVIKVGRAICLDQTGWAPSTGITTLQTVTSGNPIMPDGEPPYPNPSSAWINLVRTPFYAWKNAINGTVKSLTNDLSNASRSGVPQTVDNHIPEGDANWPPDFYNQAAETGVDNIHCSASSNTGALQSCGVMTGALASRATACTAGVAFWATDQGNWNGGSNSNYTGQGRLDRCVYVNGPAGDRLNGSGATEWENGYWSPLDFPNPLASNILAFTVQPSSSYASGATNLSATVAIQFASGETNTSATDVVTISGVGCTLSGTVAKAAVAGVAAFSSITVTGAGPCNISATATGLTSATSDQFTVNARYLEWSVNPSASIVSGATISAAPAVIIRNNDGTTDTSATDTITVSLTNCVPASGVTSSISGTLSVAASSGIATFSSIAVSGRTPDRTCQLSAAGSQITTGLGSTFRVLGATQLAFTGQPASSYTSGAVINSLVVTLYRANGVSVDTTATDPVSLTANGCIISSPTVTAVAGVATFATNVTIVSGSGACTLTASSSPDLTDATSNSFTITAAPDPPPAPGTTGGISGIRARVR